MRRGWLVILAKAPRSGAVKTRLCPPLSPRQAAELYRCLLADAIDESVRAASALDLEAVVAIEPPAAAAGLARRAPGGARVIGQCGADLGARMAHVARQAAAAGAPCALLRGSDSPTLATEALAAAALAARQVDLALAPDPDGGYGLVALGARALARAFGSPAIFDHPMSTPSVLRDTLANAERLRLTAQLLVPSFDVDRFEDLGRLAAARHESAALPCPRTLAFLDAHALWPDAGGSRARSG